MFLGRLQERFWHDAADGFATCLSPGYTSVRRIPGEVHDTCLVADRFVPLCYAAVPVVVAHGVGMAVPL